MGTRPEIRPVDVGNADLGVVRWPGAPGAPTVLAVHGITANAWSWSAVARHLDERCELVAVDLRGRGQSHTAPAMHGMHATRTTLRRSGAPDWSSPDAAAATRPPHDRQGRHDPGRVDRDVVEAYRLIGFEHQGVLGDRDVDELADLIERAAGLS